MIEFETDTQKKLFNIYGNKHGGNFAGNVYDINYLGLTILTYPGGGVPMVLELDIPFVTIS